jgi:hypothetical protein
LACLSTVSEVASSIPKHATKGTAVQQRVEFLENRREVVRVLLDACLKVAASIDKAGKTPLDYAMEKGDDQELICYLRGAAKKSGLQKKHHHQHRGPGDNKSTGLLTTPSYSRSIYKKSSANFRLRADPKQTHRDPLRNFLLVKCPGGESGDEPDNEQKVLKSVLKKATVPPEIRCPGNWKDDVSAITQPKGLGPIKVF